MPKISNLPAAGAVSGADTFPLDQGGATKLANFTTAVKAIVPFDFPSVTPTNSHIDLVVPDNGNFIDNVLTIQNRSQNGTIYGNAALRFCDRAGTERAAIGYSRNNAIQPAGYYPNTLYAEIGNPFTTDIQDTDFKIIVTHGAGAANFPSTSLVAMEVVSSSGDIRFRTQGAGVLTSHSDLYIGEVADPHALIINGASTRLRFREYLFSNQFSITSNVANMSSGGPITQDNAAKASWNVSFGGNDDFSIARAAPGGTTFANFFVLTGAGDVRLYAQGAGVITSESNHYIGELAAPKVLGMSGTTTRARVREYEFLDQFALTTNVANMAAGAPIVKDDAAKPAWIFAMGAGQDKFRIGRAAAAATAFTDSFTITAAGAITCAALPALNFANDAAAAAAGVAIGGLYNTSGAVKVRMS